MALVRKPVEPPLHYLAPAFCQIFHHSLILLLDLRCENDIKFFVVVFSCLMNFNHQVVSAFDGRNCDDIVSTPAMRHSVNSRPAIQCRLVQLQ